MTTRPVPFVDLATPCDPLVPDVVAELEGVIRRGEFTNGPAVASFEQAFAAYCGRSHCVGVASGLDALRLGLLALGIEPGDEVVVPAMTFVATFEAVVQAGGVPLVVDVSDHDFGMDMDALAASGGPRTRFVMPVHLYGQMVDVQGLLAAARSQSLLVVEDACQAHGATRGQWRAGGVGSAGAFSFYPSKNLGAMGDAGALVTDDEALATRVRALRSHGETSRYHSERIGYTARLDTVQALFLDRKLPLLDGWNASRAVAARLYADALSGVGDLRLPQTVDGATHVWHLYTVRTADPEALAQHLADHGISTGRHYPIPPHLSPAFAHLGHRPGSFPVAEAIGAETLSLPVFPGITESQIAQVAEAIEEYFARA